MEHGIYPDSFPMWEPLGTAVRNNDVAMIQLLCTAGAAPRIRRQHVFDEVRRVPLWDPERIPILNMLLTHGADSECFIADEKKGFPLVSAAMRGSLDAVNLLVQHGANVNNYVPGYNGTALQAARTHGHSDVAQRLIQLGADPNSILRESIATTFFQFDYGLHPDDLETIGDFFENIPWIGLRPTYSRDISLQKVAMEGWIPVAIMLLQHGADVAATFEGRTAIDCAAERGRFDMLQLLLNAYQGSENLRNVCDRAASYAQKQGHVEISEWLQEYAVSD
ncbi:hypothetical protein Plec18167_003706 [Paecilomyces lecythidis]|uniref:Ankyrin n=1 Tax=Paecilomyces lecythidis TaxID=3004212 RepID=A0ABR3XXH3_9EURO